jgi:hypothetical protein
MSKHITMATIVLDALTGAWMAGNREGMTLAELAERTGAVRPDWNGLRQVHGCIRRLRAKGHSIMVHQNYQTGVVRYGLIWADGQGG